MAQCALTTVDNPYDPFTQPEAWYRFDEDKGYHSCSYLARIARTSDQLSDAENEQEMDPLGIYKKVVNPSESGVTVTT